MYAYHCLVADTFEGLIQPPGSQFLRQFLLSYIPTAFATFTEPFWVVLSRLMCIIRPYEELRKGNSHPTKSILLNYNSLPPQLVLWRALKSFHLAVGLISCMAALGSLLAIGLSALFINKVIELRTTEMVIRPYLDEFIHLNSSIITSPEQFYVGVSCITARTSLPPWTDEHYLYVPFLPTKTGGPINLDSNALFEADTRAYGMDLECSDLQPDEFVVIEDSGDVSFYHMDLGVYPKSLRHPYRMPTYKDVIMGGGCILGFNTEIGFAQMTAKPPWNLFAP
jgi:hypothetical protein